MVTGLLYPSALSSGALLSRLGKISLRNEGHATLTQLGAGRFSSNSKKVDLVAAPRCLIHGVGGAGFWDGADAENVSSNNHFASTKGTFRNELDIPDGLGELSTEAQDYIRYLQSRLSLVTNELQESQLKSAALQMQNLVGEEKNDLLDYLRSLDPEKVAELSEPTSSEVQEVIQRVIHGLLATLSPKMQSKTPPQFENGSAGIRRSWDEEDGAEMIENASLQFQPLVSVTRDYLARLLFWYVLVDIALRMRLT